MAPRYRFIRPLAIFGLVCAIGIACVINPQPEPPGTKEFRPEHSGGSAGSGLDGDYTGTAGSSGACGIKSRDDGGHDDASADVFDGVTHDDLDDAPDAGDDVTSDVVDEDVRSNSGLHGAKDGAVDAAPD